MDTSGQKVLKNCGSAVEEVLIGEDIFIRYKIHDIHWMHMFSILVEIGGYVNEDFIYVSSNGELIHIGNWLYSQINAYRNGKLAQNKYELLVKIIGSTRFKRNGVFEILERA